jgi:hypothetical protein
VGRRRADGETPSSIRNFGGIDFLPAFRPLCFLFATARSRRDPSLRTAGSHLEFGFQERMRQRPSLRGLCRAIRRPKLSLNKEINAAPADPRCKFGSATVAEPIVERLVRNSLAGEDEKPASVSIVTICKARHDYEYERDGVAAYGYIRSPNGLGRERTPAS